MTENSINVGLEGQNAKKLERFQEKRCCVDEALMQFTLSSLYLQSGAVSILRAIQPLNMFLNLPFWEYEQHYPDMWDTFEIKG